MKRSPLKRKTPLKSYTGLKAKTPLKSHKPMNKISEKQKTELQKRSKLKTELIKESPKDERGIPLCSECGKPVDWDWRGFDLSHDKKLSQGGKTSKSDCSIKCRHCHNTKGHNLKETMY